MSALEAAAIERFAHALAEPVEPGKSPVVADIEARTRRMEKATDGVMKRFADSPELTETERAGRLKIVEGLIVMMSNGITAYVASIRDVGDGSIREAMRDAHDAMVDDYYRLMALKADLDPDFPKPMVLL